MNRSNVLNMILFRNKENTDKTTLIALAKSGDKEAFNSLINENFKGLYIVAKGILKSEHDIEDAFQSTVVKAYENIGTIKNEEYFKTWITRILINECNNIIRKNKKVDYVEEVTTLDTVYDDKKRDLDLITAINSLSEDLRITTWLFYFRDMPIEEISKALGIAKGTVKSRLNRSREKLYSILKEAGDNE